jgi:hypothetical protein
MWNYSKTVSTETNLMGTSDLNKNHPVVC